MILVEDLEDGIVYIYDKVLLKNNKTAVIKIEIVYACFNKQGSNKRRRYVWNVAFGIADKNKHIRKWLDNEYDLESNITGDGNIEGLIWAKNKLIELEPFLIDNYDYASHEILVGWADNRRRDVYSKYLIKKLGYKQTMNDNHKHLHKIINVV